MEQTHLKNTKVFKAFCSETRLHILSLLQSGELCACVLLEQVNVSQSTLSHHMKILVESNVVSARKEGKWMHYSICKKGSRAALELLEEVIYAKTG